MAINEANIPTSLKRFSIIQFYKQPKSVPLK